MKTSEIKKMETANIVKEIASLKKELFDLRFQNAVGQLENTAQIKKLRKDIARMYTVITERENGKA